MFSVSARTVTILQRELSAILLLLLLSLFVEGVMIEVKQRVPGGDKGSPSIPIMGVHYLSWYSSDGIQLSGPDVP